MARADDKHLYFLSNPSKVTYTDMMMLTTKIDVGLPQNYPQGTTQ